MWKVVFAVFIALILVSLPAGAQEIKDATKVNYIKTAVEQSGTLTITGEVSTLQAKIYIPQNTESQKTEITEVKDQTGLCKLSENFENICAYSIVNDNWGNSLIQIKWQNPKESPMFTVKTTVENHKQTSAQIRTGEEWMKPTDAIQSADPEIKALAETLATGSEMDRVFSLTQWVNNNIEYDLNYSDVNLSAKTVLNIRKGVCDEFSTLLMALSRSIGLQATYNYGYAYGRGFKIAQDFVPHAWTEVGGYPSDPTWSEIGFTDATHIKFASIPDISVPQATAQVRGRGNLGININEVDAKFRILEFKEAPVVKLDSSLMDSGFGAGWAVLRTKLSSDSCVQTKFTAQSCVYQGSQFMKGGEKDVPVTICGNKTYYSFFKLPDIQKGTKYTCPLSVYTSSGEDKSVSFAFTGGGIAPPPQLSISKTSVVLGEQMQVSAPFSRIFTSKGDELLYDGTIVAGKDNFTVYAYAAGALSQQNITVISKKPFDITVSANETMFAADPYNVSVLLTSKLSVAQTIGLKLKNETSTVFLEPDGTKTVKIRFVPSDKTDGVIQVFASTESFSTSSSIIVTVIERPVPQLQSFWEELIKAITEFFRSLGWIK
ncbi:MAG: transglutaminase domain-containing protein [Candidatus Aenigmarchaeota archaeon]|nr:transglutaminase domain-containing protein [Candidatus Aenigmarchaeota archaeon]